MNKTLTINLSGIVFHIDENAYEVFSAYIDSVRRHFASSEGKDEIMQDIESRIAEMFQQRVGESKQVITLHDVEEVTAAMGKPEQFGDEEKTSEPEAEKTLEGKIKRRLFRDPDDKILGGVCSGISAYFDIDPIWIRLGLAISIFVFGTGVLLYIILWIIMPKAKNTADKLMMRGERVTISNIEKNVREEFEEVKSRIKDTSGEMKEKFRTKDYSGFAGFLRRFFDGLGELLTFLLKAIGKIIAFIFIIIGIAVFIVFMLAFLTVAGVNTVQLPGVMISFFTTHALLFWALLAALLVVGIPFLLLFYHGFRMLFNIDGRKRIVNMTAGLLWLAGLLIAIITGAAIAKKYSDKANVKQEFSIMQPASDTLFVSMKTDSRDEEEEDTGPFTGWYMFGDTSTTIYGPVRLDIKRSASDKFELSKIVYSRGASRRKAMENAGGVNMSFTQTENKLVLDNHFRLSENSGFGFQNVKFVIGLPVGKMIHISKDMGNTLFDVQNITDTYDYDMAGHTWKMTENGLTCIDCLSDEEFPSPPEPPSPPAHGSIHIGGDNGDSVIIDKRGIIIKDKGKNVIRIEEKGIMIDAKEK
jgi:phage shock protein PspC (stress-responsive transcriptional regulator)